MGGSASEERDLCSFGSAGEGRVQWMGAPGTGVAAADGLQARRVRVPSRSSALSSSRMPLSQPPSPRPQLCLNLRCSPAPGGRCRLRRGSRAAWLQGVRAHRAYTPASGPLVTSHVGLSSSTGSINLATVYALPHTHVHNWVSILALLV